MNNLIRKLGGRLAGLVFTAAVLIAGIGEASASTYYLGGSPLLDATVNSFDSATGFVDGSGSVTLDYNFTLATSAKVAFTLFNSAGIFSNDNLINWSTSVGTISGSLTPLLSASTINAGTVSFNPIELSAGSHDLYIQVFSNATSDNPAIVNGNVNVSAVPLPGALVLFGSSLLGLGAVGRRRKSKATKVGLALAVAVGAPALLFSNDANAAYSDVLTLNTANVSNLVGLGFSVSGGASGSNLTLGARA